MVRRQCRGGKGRCPVQYRKFIKSMCCHLNFSNRLYCLYNVTPLYSFIFQMISTAHEHILIIFKNLNKNISATSCLFLSYPVCYLHYIFQMINTAHEHILFKFKKLNKNIPVASCLQSYFLCATCLIYFK